MSTKTSAKNLVVWITLGVIVVAFGLSFGLPDDSLNFGTKSLARLHGENVGRDEWSYQFRLASRYFRNIPRDEASQKKMRVRERMMDQVVERHVLAHAARSIGLASTTEQAEKLTADGLAIVNGITFSWLGNDEFNYNTFKQGWLENLNVSEKSYLEYQSEEFLSVAFRDIIGASSSVSDTELQMIYAAQAEFAQLEYLALDPKKFGELVDPTDGEIDDYLASHQEPLVKSFEEQATRFKNLPEQVDLWLLGTHAEGIAEKAIEQQAAAVKAEQARERLVAGESFAAVARELSDHTPTAAAGGHYGWVDLQAAKATPEAFGLTAPIIEAAQKLAPGEISAVVSQGDDFFVVVAKSKRSGDVAKDAGLRELAIEAIRTERGKTLADTAAQAIRKAAVEGKLSLSAAAAGTSLVPDTMKLGRGVNLDADVRSGLYVRRGDTPRELPDLPTVVGAAFALPEDSKVVDDIFASQDKVVLVGVASRNRPSLEEYNKMKDDLRTQIGFQRAVETADALAKTWCKESYAKGELSVNDAMVKRLMTYDVGESDAGDGTSAPYVMCQMIGE